MGHTSSKEVRHEPPNTRRLSKPQTYSPSFNISQPKIGNPSRSPSQDQNASLDESLFWKSPWTGDLLPKVAPEIHLTDQSRVRSFSSFSTLQPESSAMLGSKRWSSLDDFALVKPDSTLSRSSSYISRKLSKRASTNAQRPNIKLQSGQMTLRDTRREPVIYFGPTDIGNRDLQSSVEFLSAEDRSPIEDSHSSALLGRHQSFRRPGITRRTPSWGGYRTALSSIQQEEDKSPLWSGSTLSSPLEAEDQEELYSSVYPPSARATSPVALDYSHLIGFKKGTLRIVNDSVSPERTDRLLPLTNASLPDGLPKSAYAQADSTIFISNATYHNEAVDVRGDNLYDDHSNISGSEQSLEMSEILDSEAIDFPGIDKSQTSAIADSGYGSLSSISSGNSSNQSGSPPLNSPVHSEEEEDSMDSGEYFHSNNNMVKQHDVKREIFYDSRNERPFACREVDSLEYRCEMYTGAEQPRYYSRLGPLSIPPVPEEVRVYNKESDLEEEDMDDDEEDDDDKCV